MRAATSAPNPNGTDSTQYPPPAFAPLNRDVVKPQAQASLVKGLKGYKGYDVYDFKLWIDVPENLKPQIKQVEYDFNDPSFLQKSETSRDPKNGFAVTYRGWGCLSLVTVNVYTRGGNKFPIYFDMCAKLGPDWQ